MLANIFKKPEVLNKKTHKDLKLSKYENYEFTKSAYLVPISLEEMIVANKSVIIVFVKDTQGDIFPSVVMGGEDSENLLLAKDGSWKKNTYIPASLRCYPFGISGDEKQQFIVVDVEAEVCKKDDGNLIVKDEENLTDEGNHAVKFVTEVYTKINESKAFTTYIDKLGILKQAEIKIEMGENKYSVGKGIYIVDENSLNKLESRKLKKLATNGYMGYIYAHLLSLNNKY
ncbi:MAG: SapC family protein [Campylobacterota bacterium]|nr:SapC family protein [Campylobacterota bacterium]